MFLDIITETIILVQLFLSGRVTAKITAHLAAVFQKIIEPARGFFFYNNFYCKTTEFSSLVTSSSFEPSADKVMSKIIEI